MPTVTETGLIYRWLYSTLTGDSTLAGLVPGGWFRTRAPKTTGVFGILRFQGGSDLNAVGGGRRIWVESVYAVYVVSDKPEEAAAARIDVLLLGKQAEVTGGRINACVGEAPINLPLLEDGIARETWGRTYRIFAQVT